MLNNNHLLTQRKLSVPSTLIQRDYKCVHNNWLFYFSRVINLNSGDITLHLTIMFFTVFYFYFRSLCPSYELEFKEHHSTFINDMGFFSFSETMPEFWTWIQGLHSTSINNMIFTVFFFHFQRLCPSYELEFKGHHSTFINDMFFFIFRDYSQVLNLNSGASLYIYQ